MQDLFSNNYVNSSLILENGSSILWFQLAMALLSVVGSGSIIVFAVFQNLLGTSEVRALFFLSVANLLLCLTWIIGAVLLKQTCDDRAACYNLHTIEQILYMSSFFYTLNLLWVLCTGLKEEYHRTMTGQSALFPGRTCSLARITTVLSCILPMVLMVPVFVVGNSNNCSRNLSQSYECLLMHTWMLYAPSGGSLEVPPCHHIHIYSITIFLITFIVTFAGIVALMVKAHCVYRHCIMSTEGLLDARGWANLKVLQYQMILYASAFVVCWCPAVLLAIVTLFNLQELQVVHFVLYILQAFTSASQGLLNCFVYGWTQQRFRSLKTMEQRDAGTQTPLLRSQKQKTLTAQTDGLME
ncbi:hypothetical protein AAFF_G00047440 [Aldrovandia affinis]|uniref:G-protein coupled receptors family 1 profile domain-containing protein n=1 Tax=Aldrovandia affinis TaxID=143900 RepID=A0AAD7S1P1_9TELE|nr:hypothetical protein AAFF_G00047440 [Aldrovandia affinis]